MIREQALALVAAELGRAPPPRDWAQMGAAGEEAWLEALRPAPNETWVAAWALSVADLRGLLRARGMDARIPNLRRCHQREAFFRKAALGRLRAAKWEGADAFSDRLRDALMELLAGEVSRWGQIYCAQPLFRHREELLAAVLRRALLRDPEACAPVLDHLFGATPTASRRFVNHDTARYAIWRGVLAAGQSAAAFAALRHSAEMRRWLAADGTGWRIRTAFLCLPPEPLAELLLQKGFPRLTPRRSFFQPAFAALQAPGLAALALAARYVPERDSAASDAHVIADLGFLLDLHARGHLPREGLDAEVDALLLDTAPTSRLADYVRGRTGTYVDERLTSLVLHLAREGARGGDADPPPAMERAPRSAMEPA